MEPAPAPIPTKECEEQPFPPTSVVSSCFPKCIYWISFYSRQSTVFSSGRSICLYHITSRENLFPFSIDIYCNIGLNLSYKFGNVDRTQHQNTAPQLVNQSPSKRSTTRVSFFDPQTVLWCSLLVRPLAFCLELITRAVSQTH